MPVIQTKQLCKSYGDHQVLCDIDLTIEPGKLVGFLGPNGAGKTTTIRILLGLISANSGEANIFEKSCFRYGKQIRSEVGYLPGDVHMYPGLTGRKMLEFLARARKLDCTGEINRLASRLELELDKTVRKYSTGMRQKLGLIQALMHRPQLLILDEPTSALDPLIRQQVFEELQDVTNDGRSVLFSSHSLNEVEELCDEVVILRRGHIVEHQTIEGLRKRALKRVEVVFAGKPPSEVPKQLQAMDTQGNVVNGTWTGTIAELMTWIEPHEISDLIIERPDLNDLFIAYYSGEESATANRSSDV